MSEVDQNLGSLATAKKPIANSPMWFLCPNGMPVSASSKKIPAGATAFCCEHDLEWTPIGQKRSQDKKEGSR